MCSRDTSSSTIATIHSATLGTRSKDTSSNTGTPSSNTTLNKHNRDMSSNTIATIHSAILITRSKDMSSNMQTTSNNTIQDKHNKSMRNNTIQDKCSRDMSSMEQLTSSKSNNMGMRTNSLCHSTTYLSAMNRKTSTKPV